MTREQRDRLIESYRHEFGGMIADIGTTDKRGAELGLRLRSDFRRIDELLAKLIDEAVAIETPAKPQAAPPKR